MILYNDGKWDGIWDLPKYQEMRDKITESFKGLTFVEEGHKYFLNGKEMTCVSNVTHMLETFMLHIMTTIINKLPCQVRKLRFR